MQTERKNIGAGLEGAQPPFLEIIPHPTLSYLGEGIQFIQKPTVKRL